MFKTIVPSFLLASLLLSGSPAKGDDICATASNLVLNCGFETGNFSGWALSGDTVHAGVDTADAYSGKFGAYFAGLGSYNAGQLHFTAVGQTLNTIPGKTYVLSYYSAHSTSTAAKPDNIFFAEINQAIVPGSTQRNVGDLPYAAATPYRFTAFSSATNLDFFAEDTNFYFSLDDVSVSIQSTVPEPASFSLAALALCGLCFAGHRLVKRQPMSTLV